MEQFPDQRPTVDENAADREAVGTAVFPRSTADLRSTQQCPACFTPLGSLICSRCGLDLGQPAAIDLAAQSALIANQLDARLALIGRVRRQAAASRAALADGAPVTQASPGAPAALAATDPAAIPTAAPPPPRLTGPDPGAEPATPRRSGIQIALIVVGVSLLSVFAVFGLVYAFIAYGSGVRTLIVAAGTVATLTAATVLARRGLRSTAEGIAVLGTVILVLDAWALRENDPAGLGSLPALPYWGLALMVVAVISVIWSMLGRHATPLLAAGLLFPLGAALLAADLAADSPEGVSVATAATVGVGAALLISVLANTAVARAHTTAVRAGLHLIATAVTVVSLLVALVSTIWLAEGDSVVPGIVLAVVIGAASVLHLAVIAATASDTLSAPSRRVATSVIALVGTITLLALLIAAAATVEVAEVTIGVAVLAATALALTAEFARTRWPAPERLAPLLAAAITAGVLAAAASLVALVLAARPLYDAVAVSFLERRGDLLPSSSVTTPETLEVALLAVLALALGMAAATWWLGGLWHARARSLAPTLAVLLVLALPVLETWWVVMTLLTLAALASPLAIRALRHGPETIATMRQAARGGLATLATLAALAVAALGWAVEGAGLLGVTVALLSLALGRLATSDITARAAAMAVSALLVLGSGPSLAEELAVTGASLPSESVVLALAAIIVLLSALGRLSRLDAGVAAMTATLATAVALVITAESSLETTLALFALLGALVVVASRRAGIERSIVAALAPLGVVLLIDGALMSAETLRAVTSTSDQRALTSLAALLVVVVIAFATDGVGGGRRPAAQRFARPRILADAITLVLLVILLTSVNSDGLRAIGLLISAVIVLIAAASRDGLVRSASPRRYLGWLSLALAIAALWQWLIEEGASDPEPYVLPLAGALTVIGALLARVDSPSQPEQRGRALSGATVAILAGFAVALLPLALTAGTGPALRGAAVGAAGVLGVIAGLRAAHSASADARLLRIPGIGVGTVAVALTAQVLLAASVVIELTETVGPAALPPLSQLSGALIVIMLAGTALGAWALSPDTSPRVVRAGTAITAGTAALAAGALGLSLAVEPVEFLSIPLALALLTIGTIELERRPEARSLPWLTPGFLALLLPSLLAIGTDDSLWRVVALGLAAAAVFLGGLWRRLQSPFLIGGIVLLTHLLIQSWPLLQQVGDAVEWWLWLGLAGVIVVAIAARYERRVRNVRNTIRRIRDLR